MPPVIPLEGNSVSSFTCIAVLHRLSSTYYVPDIVPFQSLQKPLGMLMDSLSTIQMRNIHFKNVDVKKKRMLTLFS